MVGFLPAASLGFPCYSAAENAYCRPGAASVGEQAIRTAGGPPYAAEPCEPRRSLEDLTSGVRRLHCTGSAGSDPVPANLRSRIRRQDSQAVETALAVGIPDLLERMTTVCLMATGGPVDFALKGRIDGAVRDLRRQYDRIRDYRRRYSDPKFDLALISIDRAMNHFDIHSLRHGAVHELILRAAEEVRPHAPIDIDRLRARLVRP